MNWSDLTFRLFFPLVLGIGRGLLWFFGPLTVRGSVNIPRRGGLLILANHMSDLDPVAVQGACDRHIFFMAKSELFEMRPLGRIIRWFRAFPVRRGEPDKTAIKRAVELLKSGKVVGVFPEGRLSEDGKLQDLMPGVALIARMAGVPVICCGLDGTNRVMPYGETKPRSTAGGITVRWGEPFTAPREADAFLHHVRDELLRLSNQSP